MRDLSLVVSVGDVVFNQADFRLYTIESINDSVFSCRDNVTQELKQLDITAGNTLTKVKS